MIIAMFQELDLQAAYAVIALIVGFVGLVLAVAVVFAQLKLFSIDRTLKEIRDELRGGAPARAAGRGREPAPEAVERPASVLGLR